MHKSCHQEITRKDNDFSEKIKTNLVLIKKSKKIAHKGQIIDNNTQYHILL